MKIPTFLFAILLLKITSIFICTNALGEEGNIPNAENIYPHPPPNVPQEGGGITNGPMATLYNENDSDEMMNKIKPEDLNEIMTLLDDENWSHGNVPPVIGQQSIQPYLHSPLTMASENQLNRETVTDVGQELQLNKEKDKGKRKLDEYLEQNPSNANESNQLISSQFANWHRGGMFLPIGNDQPSKLLASINNENVPHFSPIQQQIMNKIPPMEKAAKAEEVERKFVCKNCGMGFKRSDYLTEHLNKKTKCIKKGSTPFVCTICERTFTEKRYLTEHMKRRTCIKKQMWYKGPMN